MYIHMNTHFYLSIYIYIYICMYVHLYKEDKTMARLEVSKRDVDPQGNAILKVLTTPHNVLI